MQPLTDEDRGMGKGETWARSLIRVLRRLFGAPDYEAYLEHCRTAGHPPRLDEREYVKQFFENKGKAPRCC
jgi:uncharacterized short protein YbdD (DUF466 family)